MAQRASRPLIFDKASETHMHIKSEAMNAKRFESHHEGWRTLWLAIAGVMAITLTWNVLMLRLNGISY
jgi:hypothetical protein